MRRVLALMLVAACGGVLRAQSTNASLTGRVTDPSKAVVADAKVTAINPDTNFCYVAATDRLLSTGSGRGRSATRPQCFGWDKQPRPGGCHAGVSHPDVFVCAGIRAHSRWADLHRHALGNEQLSWHAVRVLQE